MNRNNSKTANSMKKVHGGQVRDSGRGFRFGVCGLFVLALLLTLSIGIAYPQDATETTVVGQNDPTVDVQALQDAVDNFDIVNLEGTFHLGDEATPYTPTEPRGSIRITRAGVTLRGEGKDATKIVGGGCTYPDILYFPFTIYIDGANAVKIHGLTMEGYLGCAITPVGCEHFESIGLRITNGVLAPQHSNSYRYGWHFHTVTGDVLIKDCEYKSLDATHHWENGICSVHSGGDANFSIINNTLEVGSIVHPVWGSDAIQVGTNPRYPVGHTVRIEGNTLAGGAGIFVHRIRAAEIRNNRITARHYGLFVATASPEESQPYIIEKNNIFMEGGSAAIKCGDAWSSPWASAMTVSENTLSGSADVGFLVEGTAQDNKFIIDENDLEDLTVTTAHVSLGPDTRDNLFSLCDRADLVIVDQGMNNAFVYPAANVASATMTPALTAGQPSPLEVTVLLNVPLEATERMMLDLSPLGITSELPLDYAGEGRYTLSTTVTPPQKGRYYVLVLAETAEGDLRALSRFTLDVYPEGDLVIYEDGPGPGWTVGVTRTESDLTSSRFVRSGSFSHAILMGTNGRLKYVPDDPAGLDPFGYAHLEFYINGGEDSGQDPMIAGKQLSDLGIVPQPDTWTLVSIPISEVSLVNGRLTRIIIRGKVQEAFYLDDMKLVAKVATAVEEVSETPTPASGYALSQNYPNPFNPQTRIHYELPQPGKVVLKVFNLLGQEIRTLVDQENPAGYFNVLWNGKDSRGRCVTSGVYLYRIETQDFVQTKKLVLLQ